MTICLHTMLHVIHSMPSFRTNVDMLCCMSYIVCRRFQWRFRTICIPLSLFLSTEILVYYWNCRWVVSRWVVSRSSFSLEYVLSWNLVCCRVDLVKSLLKRRHTSMLHVLHRRHTMLHVIHSMLHVIHSMSSFRTTLRYTHKHPSATHSTNNNKHTHKTNKQHKRANEQT